MSCELTLDDIHIQIDDREGYELKSYDTCIEIKRLDVGDYILYLDNKPIVCIERKTLLDLAASIKDGRTNNVVKMREYADLHGCKLFYMIECKCEPEETEIFNGIKYSSMRGHLDRIMFHYDVHVEFVADKNGLVNRMMVLGENYIKLINKMDDYEKKERDMKMKMGSSVSPGGSDVSDYSYIKILQAFPGIGEKLSLKLADAKVSVNEIFVKCEACCDLMGLSGKKKEKLISIVADPIKTNVWKKILKEIPGIGDATAAIICNLDAFNIIMSGAITPDQLATWGCEKSKIGLSKAKKILNYLNYKRDSG
jgi:ERCC4-type nuclease